MVTPLSEISNPYQKKGVSIKTQMSLLNRSFSGAMVPPIKSPTTSV